MSKEQWKIIEGTNPGGSPCWIVSGTKADGTRIRERKKSPGIALTRKQELETEALNLAPVAHTVAMLSEAQAREAEAAFHRITGHKLTLSQLVSFALENWKDSARPMTVAKAFALFITEKEQGNRRPRTIQDLNKRLAKLVTVAGEKLVSDVMPDVVEKLIFREGSSLLNRRNDRVVLSGFFTWCQSKSITTANPCADLPEIIHDTPEPEILRLAQVQKLMQTAREFKGGKLVPYLTLALFCGIRPAEIARLNWDAINLKAGHVSISGAIAKMRARRLVNIEPNAVAFLAEHATKKTPLVGTNWLKDFAKVRELAGLIFWPQDVMRHTAISMHLAKHEHEGKTAAWAGNSPDVIQQHYKGLVTREDCAAFWDVMPGDGEIITLPEPQAANG